MLYMLVADGWDVYKKNKIKAFKKKLYGFTPYIFDSTF